MFAENDGKGNCESHLWLHTFIMVCFQEDESMQGNFLASCMAMCVT